MTNSDRLVVPELSEKERKRIFSKILIDPTSGCWIWTGARDFQGYGMIHFKGRTERVHRLLYAYLVEPVPKGILATREMQIDHAVCHNPSCCNPNHLELVTQRTNILRSNGPTAINARKTHCIHGHLLKKVRNGKRRECPTCDSERHKVRSNGPNREYWLEKQRQATKRCLERKKNNTG